LCRANQYPLAADLQRQAPTSIEFYLSLGALLVAPVGLHFSQLSLFPIKSASTLRLLSYDMSLTALLSLAEVAVVRLLARYASYPCLFSGLRQCPLAATYPAPGSYLVPVVPTYFAECVSRFPSSGILLAVPQAVVGRSAIFWLRSVPVCSVCIRPLGLTLPRAS